LHPAKAKVSESDASARVRTGAILLIRLIVIFLRQLWVVGFAVRKVFAETAISV
jgi:hypothetical protein